MLPEINKDFIYQSIHNILKTTGKLSIVTLDVILRSNGIIMEKALLEGRLKSFINNAPDDVKEIIKKL
jgi:hypothetical protein